MPGSDDPDRPKNSFDQLSEKLSRDERKDFLHRVKQENLDDDEMIYNNFQNLLDSSANESLPKTVAKNQYSRLIQSELLKMSLLTRISLALKAFFLKKTLHQTFAEDQLINLKRSITSKGSYINFDSGRTIALRFVTEVFRLHAAVVPLKTVHLNVWKNHKNLNKLATKILSQDEILSPFKVHIKDFTSKESLLEIFIKTQSESSVKQAVLKAQRDYFKSIPSSVFRNVSDKLLSLYILSNLLTFQFKELLILMGLTETQQREGTLSKIRAVPVFPAIDLLEKLLSLLTLLSVRDLDLAINEDFFEIALSKDETKDKSNKITNMRDISENILKINQLVSAIQLFLLRVPLHEIVAYFKHDPFYKIPEYKIKFSIKNFYIKSSTTFLSKETDDILEEIRLLYIQDSMNSFFTNVELSSLKYYTPHKNPAWDALELDYLIYAKALLIALNFLNLNCTALSKTESIKTLLNATSLTRTPILQGKFQDFFTTVELCKTEIINFDESLAPETPQGREFINHKEINITEAEVEKLKTMQYFFDQIDIQARDILKKNYEFLLSFVQFIKDKILESNVEFIQTQVSAVYPQLDRNRPLITIIKEWTTRTEKLAVMLRELCEYQENLRNKKTR